MQHEGQELKLHLVPTYLEIIEELRHLLEMNGSPTIALDILKRLPEILQLKVIRFLGSEQKVMYIPFFQLLVSEEQGDLQKEASEILASLQNAGHQVQGINPLLHKPYQHMKVYCSATRLTGQCVLLFAIKNSHQYLVHFFTLCFNFLGIKNYVQYSSINEDEILTVVEREKLLPLTCAEGQGILWDAYQQNLRFGTKAATGFSQYYQLLQIGQQTTSDKDFLWKVSGHYLLARHMINALLLAFKNMDAALIYDLALEDLRKEFGSRSIFLQKWTHPLANYMFLKSTIKTCIVDNQESFFLISLVVSDEEDNLKRVDLKIVLTRLNKRYYLKEITIAKIIPLSLQDPLCPLNQQVYACVYKVDDFQRLKTSMESHEKLYLSGEFDHGVCFKFFRHCDPLEYGIDISKNIVAEFILTANELIVFSCELQDLTKISEHIQASIQTEEMQLRIKTRCTIQEIYKVNLEKAQLGKNLLAKTQSFLIPPAKLDKWEMFCTQSDKITFKAGKNKIVHFYLNNDLIEIIFHRYYAILNLFDNSLSKLKEQVDLPDLELYPLSDFLGKQTIDNWSAFKLVKELKKDPLIKVYLPLLNDSMKQIAEKFNLLIV